MEDRDRTVTALKRKLRAATDLMTDRDLIQLYNQLLGLGRQETERQLRLLRMPAFEFLGLPDARQRRTALRRLERQDSLFLAYAAAAWVKRTLVLFELVQRHNHGPVDIEQWAGFSALGRLAIYESDESWIWPYPTRSPFVAP